MGKIISYKEGAHSQIKFESGERILFSIASTGIAIFKLKFFGMFPGGKIAEWSSKQMAEFIVLFGGAPLNQTPFNFTVNKLTAFENIQSLKNFLLGRSSTIEVTRKKNILDELNKK